MMTVSFMLPNGERMKVRVLRERGPLEAAFIIIPEADKAEWDGRDIAVTTKCGDILYLTRVYVR